MGKSEIILCFILMLYLNGLREISASINFSFGEKNEPKLDILRKYVIDVRNNITHFAYPYLIKMSREVNLSVPCKISGIKLYNGLKLAKTWSMKMLDSVGRPVTGLQLLSFWLLGNYDQCLNIIVPKNEKMPSTFQNELFRGKYCVLKIKNIPLILINAKKSKESQELIVPGADIEGNKNYAFTMSDLKYFEKFFEYRMDLCVPSACNNDDLKNVIRWFMQDTLPWYLENCTVKNEVFEYTKGQIICLVFFCCCFISVLISTILHVIVLLLPNKLKAQKIAKTLEKYSSISLFKNIEKLLKVDQTDKLHWLCGLRVCFLYAIVFGHDFYFAFIYPTVYRDVLNFPYMFDYPFYYTISGIPISIEYFFFISAFISYWQKFIHGKDMKINYLKIFLKTYFRLTIPVLMTIVFLIILPLFGDGPHWKEIVEKSSRTCENEWWQFPIHINNFFLQNRSCASHLWFMAVLMQLSFVSLIILYIQIKWPNFGTILLFLLVLVGTVSNMMFYIISKNYYILGIPKLSEYRKLKQFIIENYAHPYYSHLSSYCLGLLTGYFLAKNRELKLKKKTLCLGWITFFVLIWYSYYGLYHYKDNTSANQTVIIVYHSLYRLAATVALAWVCTCYISGYGGIFIRFFSCKLFIILDRINIWIYLLHFAIIQYILGSVRDAISMNSISMWMFYSYVLTLSIVTSLFFYIFLQPALEKIVTSITTCRIFQRKKKNLSENEIRISIISTRL